MSDAALRQRRRNLKRTRIRSDRETAIIKRLIWQACFDGGDRPSHRALARQLGVWPSYVAKVQRKAQNERTDVFLANGRRVTLDDLEKARSFTEKVRAEVPDILTASPGPIVPKEPRVMTVDAAIAETWREATEWKKRNFVSRSQNV